MDRLLSNCNSAIVASRFLIAQYVMLLSGKGKSGVYARNAQTALYWCLKNIEFLVQPIFARATSRHLSENTICSGLAGIQMSNILATKVCCFDPDVSYRILLLVRSTRHASQFDLCYLQSLIQTPTQPSQKSSVSMLALRYTTKKQRQHNRALACYSSRLFPYTQFI